MTKLTKTGEKLSAKVPIADPHTYRLFRGARLGAMERVHNWDSFQKHGITQQPKERYEADLALFNSALEVYEAEHGREGHSQNNILFKDIFYGEWEMDYEGNWPPQMTHPGYTAGALWNGWSTPYFTKEEGFKVMEGVRKSNWALCAARGEPLPAAEEICYFDEEKDAFVFCYDGDPLEEPNIFDSGDYDTEDGRLHLYCIGGWCWTWSNYEEEEGEDD